MIWKLAWRSGKGRLAGYGILPRSHESFSTRKIGSCTIAQKQIALLKLQRLVLYTVRFFCCAPRILNRCFVPPSLLYSPPVDASPNCQNPVRHRFVSRMHALDHSWRPFESRSSACQISSNLFHPFGYSPHFSPPLPFPLFCFGSVAPAASPFFSACCP